MLRPQGIYEKRAESGKDGQNCQGTYQNKTIHKSFPVQCNQPAELGSAHQILLHNQRKNSFIVFLHELFNPFLQQVSSLTVFLMNTFQEIMQNFQFKNNCINNIVLIAVLLIQGKQLQSLDTG